MSKQNLPRKIEHSEEDNKWKQSVHRWCPLATTSSTTSTASRHGHDGRQHHGPVRCATTHFEAFIWQRWAVVNFSPCQWNLIKNISGWNPDYTDDKNSNGFYIRLVKWTTIPVKKCQNLIVKVNFQRLKPSKFFYFFRLKSPILEHIFL